MSLMARGVLGAVMCVMPAWLQAAEWKWQWPAGAAGDAAPQVEVTPFLYGKDWAYTIEIDDCPVLTLDIAQPLLAKQRFTDAPPGVAGGKPMPFVGGAAVIVVRVGGNKGFLSWDDLRTLQDRGWGVLNHSYFHKGRSWGDKPEILSAEHVRNDLFWSQTLIANETGGGRAPTHFVYPNGYTGYQQYLGEFGMFSGSRSAGTSVRFPYADEAKNIDNPRNYMDEKSWTAAGKSEVMWSFPDGEGPAVGQLVIDFTHGIEAPGTENYGRWEKRLATIGTKYGMGGKDNLWSAPDTQIFSYVNARKQAKVTASTSGIAVSLPDSAPASRLTLKLKGLSGDLGQLPEGTTVYRQGDTVWVTTPMIGQAGAPAPLPAVERVYAGPVQTTRLEKPAKIAAVRLLQKGKPADGFELSIAARTPAGESVSLITPEQKTLPNASGTWHLYSVVPNGEGVLAEEVQISADPALEQMEIWVLR